MKSHMQETNLEERAFESWEKTFKVMQVGLLGISEMSPIKKIYELFIFCLPFVPHENK